MKMGWILGWAVPPAWFAGIVREFFPGDEHVFVAPAPDAVDLMLGEGAFDWIAGYSLGSLLLLKEQAALRLGRVALLAPIFGFVREAGAGGRIPEIQLDRLARRLERDAAGALAEFYRQTGLDIPAGEAPLDRPALLWGLEALRSERIAPLLPEGWLAWCGDRDPLIDGPGLRRLVPEVSILAGAGHHPRPLIGAFSRRIGAGVAPGEMR